jgi:hypothetical protein
MNLGHKDFKWAVLSDSFWSAPPAQWKLLAHSAQVTLCPLHLQNQFSGLCVCVIP